MTIIQKDDGSPRQEGQSESDQQLLEFKSKFNELQAESKRICDSKPNICFFRIFGKKIEINKLKSIDPESDIDLRCIFKGSITQEEKDVIHAQLNAIIYPTPVEIQFTELSEYEEGKIGKHGEFTIDKLLANPKLYKLNPDIRLNHPELILLYDLATSEEFSHKTEEIDSEYSGALNISHLLESLEISQESGSEWADIVFFQFLEHYKKESEYTLEYAQRLAKYCIRTAFCLLVAQTPKDQLPQLKEEIITSLKQRNGFGDLAFLSILLKKSPPWLRNWHEILLSIGEIVRETDDWMLKVLKETTTDPNQSAESANNDRLQRVYNVYCYQTEQFMFELANLSSGHDRRNIDSFDPMVRDGIEFLLQRILIKDHPEFVTQKKNNEAFITQGTPGESLFFIPTKKANGEAQLSDKTQGVALYLPEEVEETDDVIVRDVGRIIGELAVLLNIPRTTTVKVKTDGEPLEMYEIPKDFILELFNNPQILYFLRHPELCETKEDSTKLHLYTLLLKYFSYEFLSTIRDIEKLSKKNHSTTESIELLKQNNPFSEFLTDDLGNSVLELFSSESNPQNFEVINCEERTTLFSSEDPQSEYLFISVSCTGEHAVEASNFAGNPETVITIAPNIFFGDSSLLRFGTRSATVTALPGSVILKCSVVEFEKLTSNYGLLSNGQSVQELLFAVAATNLGRINRSLEQQ